MIFAFVDTPAEIRHGPASLLPLAGPARDDPLHVGGGNLEDALHKLVCGQWSSGNSETLTAWMRFLVCHHSNISGFIDISTLACIRD